MSYYSNTNLMNSPYAERMSFSQARELMSHINPDRKVPDWMLALVAQQRTEPEIREVLDEYLKTEAELDAGKTLGFSCHGPWEDPLNCLDACETCPFWQQDPLPYPILARCIAGEDHRTDEARAEALEKLVADYHAWVRAMEEYSDALEAEQIGAEEQVILEEYLAQREDETEKQQAEAEVEYQAEYAAWVVETAQKETNTFWREVLSR